MPLKGGSRVPLRREVCGEQNRGQPPPPQLRSWLVAFRGEDCFWIRTGDLADRNPADATDQRSD